MEQKEEAEEVGIADVKEERDAELECPASHEVERS